MNRYIVRDETGRLTRILEAERQVDAEMYALRRGWGSNVTLDRRQQLADESQQAFSALFESWGYSTEQAAEMVQAFTRDADAPPPALPVERAPAYVPDPRLSGAPRQRLGERRRVPVVIQEVGRVVTVNGR